uniref:Uncharacterized protein n=1 Tax=Oryza punctata TaxID=4537 RepID=A0A0E0JLN6_ORYPU
MESLVLASFCSASPHLPLLSAAARTRRPTLPAAVAVARRRGAGRAKLAVAASASASGARGSGNGEGIL